jgi:hypothetical protein
MELQQQVCSLDLAKRLKELGVEQESIFWWCGDVSLDFLPQPMTKKEISSYNQVEFCEPGVSAFTVAELGEMLPKRLHQSNLTITRGVWWEVCYDEATVDTLGGYKGLQTADTEADARAKMLIYLIENKLLAA